MKKRSRAHEAGSIEAGSSISKSIFFANRVDRAVVGGQIEPAGAPRSAQSSQIEPATAPGAARSSQSRPDRARASARSPRSPSLVEQFRYGCRSSSSKYRAPGATGQIAPARAPGAARSSQSKPDRASQGKAGRWLVAQLPAHLPGPQAWSSNFVMDFEVALKLR